jgi:hypothetical protein
LSDYFAVLKAELALSAYGSMDDATAAAALNAANIQTHIDVPVSQVEAYLRLNGKVSALSDWIEANTTPSAWRTFARELLAIVSSESKLTAFATANDTQRAQLKSLFDALVANNVAGIAQTDEDAIFALANGPVISRAQQLGLGSVSTVDVTHARSAA